MCPQIPTKAYNNNNSNNNNNNNNNNNFFFTKITLFIDLKKIDYLQIQE